MRLIDKLISASDALLEAELQLHAAGVVTLARAARDLAEVALSTTRDAITRALETPGDAWDRRDLLDAALRIDGVASPLAATAARRFAEAAEAANAVAA